MNYSGRMKLVIIRVDLDRYLQYANVDVTCLVIVVNYINIYLLCLFDTIGLLFLILYINIVSWTMH